MVTCTASAGQLNLAKTQQTDHSYPSLRVQGAGKSPYCLDQRKQQANTCRMQFPKHLVKAGIWKVTEIIKSSKFKILKNPQHFGLCLAENNVEK